MEKLQKLIQEKFDLMCKSGMLFRSSISGQEIWDKYISSFISKPIFRDPTSTIYTCNHCKNFIRRYGNIVSIDETNNLVTMFDVECDEEYQNSMKELSILLKNSSIDNVFFETFDELNSLPYESCKKTNEIFKLGVDSNVKIYNKEEAEKHGVVKEGEIRKFHHMHLHIPNTYVDISGKSIESIMGKYRDSKNVFKRGMDEISLDTLFLVRDLINQNSLLDGAAHLFKIEKIIPLKEEYDKLSIIERDNWCWKKSFKFQFAKFRNELIGVLCTELSEGMELNSACINWNKRVDPINYMKASAPITKKQIEQAKQFVEENGYEESFNRRLANIEDIKISEILHSNVGDGKVKSASIFDQVKSTSTRHKRSEFDKIEEIPIEKFMKDILPGCTSVHAYLENRMEGNMVSLTKSINDSSKPIFKWSNNYSWTFNGNLTGKSQIKDAVKTAGGKIDGALRFSIIWNEYGKDIVDFDAHALEPDHTEIFYSSPYRKDRGNQKTKMTGQLDVDMINPIKLGVENIVWSDINKMKDGIYKLWIRNFNGGQNKGFKAEIEFDDEIYSYEYNRPIDYKGDINVAEVTLKNGYFTIKHLISESTISSKEVFGLKTNQFHKVNLVCLSPNHWNENNIGNKHYLFMLENCINPSSIRSFHIENLIPELLDHRKVLEVLGNTSMIPQSNGKQLSGLGFNATVRDELILKLEGTHKRIIKLKF